ncbi:flagellar basal body P-ring formation chaperone FlgA [Cupriavidus agavae]|uniref:Flagella basal body P-ring formation protein FlgA n=1 Tax=Cupriavidus agavae TaxID=1001822 RepID=A0A4Q7R8W4_9BURK|nr:flagellar basal body P-ring formation chaperone FlgA [Cupriavidus agavae]RZT29284.1 flagella basal body P-ring formation protein FlgA [Cupriavidus agavae]
MTLSRQAAALLAAAGIALAPSAMAAQVTPVAMPGAAPAHAAAANPFTDDPARTAVEQFLLRQANGLPGKVSVQVVPPSGGRAPDCFNPEPFLPAGAAAYGRVNVGVRCGGDRPWTRYMQARVSVLTDYYVAARSMGPGETITAADLEVRQGDLGALPRAVVTDPSQVEGSVAANRIAAGSPLRTDLLKRPIAVKLGQTVNVTVEGQSFQLSSEGKVLADAATGANVQVRLRNGQVVSGVVRSGDTVALQ